MGEIVIKGLTKRYGPVTAVEDLDLDVESAEFVTLLGPSGCGKTTTLRCIAGLEKPDAGEIVIDGRTVVSAEKGIFVPPEKRDVGMVFQSYALWPHMTAFDNVAFPLRRAAGRRWSPGRPRRSEVEGRVLRALEMVHCEDLARRHPGEMSGGQQQRVALARAIVGSPRLVLMDEPLSNLDAKLRARLRFELRSIQQELGFTALYVTHDRAEAMSMSDVVVVLRDGRIEQVGPPDEVYHHPASSYVSDFLGDHNLVRCRVAQRDAAGIGLETPLGRARAKPAVGAGVETGQAVVAAIARGAISVDRLTTQHLDGDAAGGVAEVAGVAYYGWYSEVLLRLERGDEVTVRTEGRTDLELGERVRAEVTAIAAVEVDAGADLEPAGAAPAPGDGAEQVTTGKALA